MTESNGERNILTASRHMSIGSMREKARTGTSTPVEQLVAGQKDLLQSLEGQKITLDQFLGKSVQQTDELVESMKGAPILEERSRWTDAEFKQDFYTRFTPNLEPRFYTKLDKEQREVYEARWRLARAAFYKRATAGTPDKYRENQDLDLLGKEQMERLYKVPGVKEMLHAYTQAICENKLFGKKSFWEIDDVNQFEKFRETIRETVLPNSLFLKEKEVRTAGSKKEKGEWIKLFKTEADAIAWNWLWVGCLVESVDSRYSERTPLQHKYSHMNFPGAIVAGEYKYIFHPQERFEGKCVSRHFWGAFGEWGVTQMDRIMKELENESGYDKDKDEFWFSPTTLKEDYWTWRKVSKEEVSLLSLLLRDAKKGERENKRKEKGGGESANIYIVRAPECYPTTTTRSFWEETLVDTVNKDGEPTKKPLIEYLIEDRCIPWGDVPQDSWSMYLFGKFHKAYQLLEYYSGGKDPLEERKEREWTAPLLELFARLKYIPEDKAFSAEKSKFHNLKVWAVYASYGGVQNPTKREVTIPLKSMDKNVMSTRLAHPQIRYLDKGETLVIRDIAEEDKKKKSQRQHT